MSVIYIILPLALLLGLCAIFAFSWAIKNGQLDDLDTPPVRILFDEDKPYGDNEKRGNKLSGERKR